MADQGPQAAVEEKIVDKNLKWNQIDNKLPC